MLPEKRKKECDRSKVIDAIETHLLHNPTQESKSRIKRLRDMDKPQ